ncbi:ribonuclease III [Kineobactrum salinum]|uniref:Ribonuclease 3 n=1 Tax=Kineobactrum salinum TaxID=2708301 RepID=A0A6C0TXB7_9GAMM|nr:ribonuclease III [Kineobactrum salinum]QIB64480.1 ribonuclease III [Kineobactrum salinum]
MEKRQRLQRILGYDFSDPGLLTLALTHRSASGRNNERLEFLGDSIVNHVVAEALYAHFPQAREGELSRMRAALVKGDTLAEIAAELGLGEFIALGTGERKSGGHRRQSILADALEAVAGAILLDSDVNQCRACLLRWFDSRLQGMASIAEKDAKTRLQEYLQGVGRPLPQYELLAVEGADHRQRFRVACRLADPAAVIEGVGSSRRRAEQVAAAAALEELENHG